MSICLYGVALFLFRCVNKDSHQGQRRYTSIQDNLILSKLFTYISHSWKVLKDSEKSENFKWDMRLYVWTWSKYRINLSFIDFWYRTFDFCAIPWENKSWMEVFKKEIYKWYFQEYIQMHLEIKYECIVFITINMTLIPFKLLQLGFIHIKWSQKLILSLPFSSIFSSVHTTALE